jgi:hypothetical protein
MQKGLDMQQRDPSRISTEAAGLPFESGLGRMIYDTFTVDEMPSASWHQQLANDLAAEMENFAGEKRCTIPELRRFFAIKGCRDLLGRLRAARDGKTSYAALRSVAMEMRQYALERPALWAAASRTPNTDCSEWRTGHKEICDFIKSVLAECEVYGRDAEDALYMLRSLVRGFALHQTLGSFLHVNSYDESFDRVIDIFIAGLQALVAAGSARSVAND